MTKINLSKKEREHIIFLLERENKTFEKAINTPVMGENKIDIYKDAINMNNITLEKLNNEKT